ncbi:hypothetical protein BH09PSE1_BH09PSE1_16000 [soil metagenome]
MRRFLIWSGLAVVIGLVLAVSGYLAYDHFYARFQPATIARNQGEIQRLLDEASWVSPGGGDQPLYIIGYRDSVPTQGYERQEADKLRAGGVDVRVLMFARPDREGAPQSSAAERATIAELWLNRDWDLYRRWTTGPTSAWTAPGVAPADGNLARTAVVGASRQFVDRLDVLMRDAGVKPTWPLVIWRDREGFLKACACADSRSWAFIRDDLNAPDAFGPAGTAPIDAPMTPAPMTPAPVQPAPVQGLPYPNLPAPVPGSPVQPAPAPARSATAANPTSPTRSPSPSSRLEGPTRTPRTPPRPTTPPPPQPEDTQFF